MKYKVFSPQLTNFFLLLLLLFPPGILAKLIFDNSVNLPVWDQWGVADFLININEGNISFENFFYQQNESRLLFPRIIFLSLASMTHWDVRYEMIAIFGLACLVCHNIYQLSRATFTFDTKTSLFLAFFASLLIFSPIQAENWTWGIQLITFIPIACITTCMVVLHSKLYPTIKLIICLILATISTFSYANGILSWLIIFPLIALHDLSKPRKAIRQRWLILGWLTGFTLNLVLYFHNYVKPSHHPSTLHGVFHPLQAISYFLSFLGAPLGFGNIVVAQIVGAFLILIYTLVALCILKDFRSFPETRGTISWLMLGAYSVISALITTAGRVGFGVEQSLSYRYTTFSIYLTISVIYLVAFTIYETKKGILVYFAQQIKLRRLAVALAVIFLSLHSLSFIHGSKFMTNVKESHLRGKSCLLFINVVPEKECLESFVYPDKDSLISRANKINKMGFLQPALIESNKMQNIEGNSSVYSDTYGVFDGITKLDNGNYLAYGWAILPNRKETADSVILAYEDPQGNPIAFAISDTKAERKDIVEIYGQKAYSKSGWSKSFSNTRIPINNVKITAWAFNTSTGKAFKLNESHSLIKQK